MNVSELTELLTSVGTALGGLAAVITGIAKLIESWKKPKDNDRDK